LASRDQAHIARECGRAFLRRDAALLLLQAQSAGRLGAMLKRKEHKDRDDKDDDRHLKEAADKICCHGRAIRVEIFQALRKRAGSTAQTRPFGIQTLLIRHEDSQRILVSYQLIG
jgi:hypothetical protein